MGLRDLPGTNTATPDIIRLLKTNPLYYRLTLERMCLTYFTNKDKPSLNNLNVYKSFKQALLKDKVDEDTAEFGAKLMGWLRRDGSKFTKFEASRLDLKNIAYINEEGIRTVIFLGVPNDKEDEIGTGLYLMHLVAKGDFNYGIDVKDNEVKFWITEFEEKLFNEPKNKYIIKPP